MVEKLTKWHVLVPFTARPSGEYHLRELAQALKRPHSTIRPYLSILVKEDILILYRKKKITNYKLNLKNPKIFDYLTITEKIITFEKLKTEKVLELLYEKLSAFFSENSFLIFGSSVMSAKASNDIDLLMIGAANLKKNLNIFEETYGRKLHIIQVAELQMINSALKEELLKKHIIFNDTERFVRWLYG